MSTGDVRKVAALLVGAMVPLFACGADTSPTVSGEGRLPAQQLTRPPITELPATLPTFGDTEDLAGGVVELRAVTTDYGQVIADGKGRVLYTNPEAVASSGLVCPQCPSSWRPVLAEEVLTAPGIDGSLVRLVDRRDGTRHVWFKQHPLYLFAGDSRAGSASGADAGDGWAVLGVTGDPVIT